MFRCIVRRFVVALFPLVVLSAPAAAEPHPFSIHDMLAMKRIGTPVLSPDEQRIVFTLRTTDLDANKGRTDLWIVSVDGDNLRQLTSHPDADGSPQWSRDGKFIYFISTRGGSSQVWRMSPDGGEATQVTHQPLDVAGFLLSPDGKRLAIAMEVYPDLRKPAETKARLDEEAKKKTSGRVYDRLFFRHWDTWKDGRRSHLFIVPVDDKGRAVDDEVVDITAGMDADIPSKPFGGMEEIAFSHDSSEIVFVARDVGRTEAWSTNLDLFVATVDGKSQPRRLTKENEALDTSPVFSPDGKALAYLAMSRPGYEADRQRIMMMDWPGGKPMVLAESWDRSASEIAWAADGRSLFVTAQNIGQHSLFHIDLVTQEVKPVVWEGTVHNPMPAKDRVYYTLNSLTSPAELMSASLTGKDVRAVTKINAPMLAAAKLGDPEQFAFEGAGGDQVYAYVVKPVDFDPGKKYPVAFLIHGGPQGSFGNDFHYRWNPQAYAGAGYAAVMVDFHGSTGYGQVFCDAIRGDWGGKPLEDLQKGLDAALKRYPWMDGDRVAALGASYGGYMINWIAGNWPDRFKCLVCHDGNLCERLAYFDTEELWFPEWDHMGNPWENPDHYDKHNPINHVGKWKTPMLVIHGGLDYRVVDTQGMSTFTALQRRGIPSKFLYFPDENHWVLKPANSILWHETVIGWLDQWTK